MGNFEKVVVLLILLVCAVVLTISLRAPSSGTAAEPGGHSGDESGGELSSSGDAAGNSLREALAESQGVAESRDKSSSEFEVEQQTIDGTVDSRAANLRESLAQLGTAEAVPAGGSGSPGTNALRTLAPPTSIDPILSSLVATGDGRELALVSAAGLRETVSPDYMIYTCREGDNWLELSRRYYGDSDHEQLLRIANETRETLVVGAQIMVPAFELEFESPSHEAAAPRTPSEYTIYVVESGDSLSTISSALYGTGSRWMELFDANRDVLADPHSLKVGQELRVP